MPNFESYRKVTCHFCLGALFGVALSIGPVALINHRHLSTFLFQQSWTIYGFCVISLLAGGLVAACAGKDRPADNKYGYRQYLQFLQARWLEILAAVCLFLYIACAALCQ